MKEAFGNKGLEQLLKTGNQELIEALLQKIGGNQSLKRN